jgi:hypothetical protein
VVPVDRDYVEDKTRNGVLRTIRLATKAPFGLSDHVDDVQDRIVAQPEQMA